MTWLAAVAQVWEKGEPGNACFEPTDTLTYLSLRGAIHEFVQEFLYDRELLSGSGVRRFPVLVSASLISNLPAQQLLQQSQGPAGSAGRQGSSRPGVWPYRRKEIASRPLSARGRREATAGHRLGAWRRLGSGKQGPGRRDAASSSAAMRSPASAIGSAARRSFRRRSKIARQPSAGCAPRPASTTSMPSASALGGVRRAGISWPCLARVEK